MNKRLSMPDGMRVIAIGLVVWFHIWQQSWLAPVTEVAGRVLDLTPLVRTGYVMVDVMLLLSGYLLFMPIARGEKLDIPLFHKKRLARILPSYLLCVLVMLFAVALPENGWKLDAALYKDLLSHLTFTHTFFRETYFGTALNLVLWTLAIEMQFYFIFPVVSAWFKRAPVATYGLMVVGAFAFREFIAGRDDMDMYMNQLPAMLDVYANGMLAAVVTAELEQRKQSQGMKLFFTLLSLFGFFLLWELIQVYYGELFPMEARRLSQLDHRFALSAVAALILVSGESSFLLYRCIFSNPVTRFLAGISFNVYIWHQVLALKLKEWEIPNFISENPSAAGEMPWQLSYTICCFFLALFVGTVVTYLFERPLTKMITHTSHKRRCKDKKCGI